MALKEAMTKAGVLDTPTIYFLESIDRATSRLYTDRSPPGVPGSSRSASAVRRSASAAASEDDETHRGENSALIATRPVGSDCETVGMNAARQAGQAALEPSVGTLTSFWCTPVSSCYFLLS